MHVLFANTGVQLICVPLRGGSRYTGAQIGYGWQRLCCGTGGDGAAVRDVAYVQWQLIQSGTARLFLAVDTTCGEPDLGYFCAASSLTQDFVVRLEGILDLDQRPLKGLPAIEICIRPTTATAGEARPVHMVVDFGNSRTGALLLELTGEVAMTPQMIPFELINRYHLDAWTDTGEFRSMPSARWFSSRTHWCNTPYLPPQTKRRIEYQTIEEESRGGLFGRSKKPKQAKVESLITPPLFDDLSAVRLGREAEDVTHVMRVEGDIRTGLSSPKRYLWADDASWLEGANWYMADPSDRCHTGAYANTLQGPFLRYVHEDDRDFLLNESKLQEKDFAVEVPHKPRHSPRSLMTAALYELLCQAYSHLNSFAYRNASGDAGRAREIRTLTLTHPSGMISEELERLRLQAAKAIEIFARSLGKHQRVKPELYVNVDEATAVHLTYIWSELKMLGQDPRLWFGSLRQDRELPRQSPEAVTPAPATLPPAARRLRPVVARSAAGAAAIRGANAESEPRQEIRIACIDIGGGTTDLMIARYQVEYKIDDTIHGEVLHQDGISLAGDQLVKRLLECVVVPAFADALGLEEEDVQLLFGPEVPRNREFRAQRVNWMNRLFVPLAHAYLGNAADEISDDPICHTLPELVDPTVLESLQQIVDRLRGPGYYNVQQELGLSYNSERFRSVVHDVFDELLFDLCERIMSHRCDVVLLAGLPSKISLIQEIIQLYLPLSPSRIVPMHQHYAGNWYPYQDETGRSPGVIVDPKSPVVVGAAIEFMARHGMLPQFRFQMKTRTKENSYYWGVMVDATSGMRNERILFEPAEERSREDITEFSTSSQRVIIGRKMNPNESAQATPVYLLKMHVGDRIGPTDVRVKIRRRRASGETEESLEVDSISGTVAGQDAVLGENVLFKWRTLSDERYYLDTGGLDNIEWNGTR